MLIDYLLFNLFFDVGVFFNFYFLSIEKKKKKINLVFGFFFFNLRRILEFVFLGFYSYI